MCIQYVYIFLFAADFNVFISVILRVPKIEQNLSLCTLTFDHKTSLKEKGGKQGKLMVFGFSLLVSVAVIILTS